MSSESKERPAPEGAGHGGPENVDKVTSEELAILIVDALLRADLLRAEDVGRAIRIATEEIEVRKAFGSY